MVEEVKDPRRVFPRAMLTGLGIAVVLYMLVAVAVVAVLSARPDRRGRRQRGGRPARRRARGAARLPDRRALPVPHGLRGRQHGADQHADGQPADLRHGPPGRAPPVPRQGRPGPPLAVDRDRLHDRSSPWGSSSWSASSPRARSARSPARRRSCCSASSRSSTSRSSSCAGTSRTPTPSARRPPRPSSPGSPACSWPTPLARDRDDWIQYQIAGVPPRVGVVLWAITAVINRRSRHQARVPRHREPQRATGRCSPCRWSSTRRRSGACRGPKMEADVPGERVPRSSRDVVHAEQLVVDESPHQVEDAVPRRRRRSGRTRASPGASDAGW